MPRCFICGRNPIIDEVGYSSTHRPAMTMGDDRLFLLDDGINPPLPDFVFNGDLHSLLCSWPPQQRPADTIPSDIPLVCLYSDLSKTIPSLTPDHRSPIYNPPHRMHAVLTFLPKVWTVDMLAVDRSTPKPFTHAGTARSDVDEDVDMRRESRRSGAGGLASVSEKLLASAPRLALASRNCASIWRVTSSGRGLGRKFPCFLRVAYSQEKSANSLTPTSC